MFSELTVNEFSQVLASKAPVPGGGGASAVVGALGSALGSMVGNLTTGKKKYAQFEEDIQRILKDAEKLRTELLVLADEDAKAFEPLSKAYSIPKDSPDRDEVMEEALKTACKPPMDIVRTICQVIDLHEELCDKGSMLAISDVGVGVLCCRAALLGAALNVYINLGSMKDFEYAKALETEMEKLISEYTVKADTVYKKVMMKLGREVL